MLYVQLTDCAGFSGVIGSGIMDKVLIHSEQIEMVPVGDLTPHPRNRNEHPPDQIERMKKIIRFQGFRRPLTVSNLSGHITTGEGRWTAAKELGMTHVPVIYQDYESEDQEYADIQADNALAAWARLDHAKINADLPELCGQTLDIDFLGIKKFTADRQERDETVSADSEIQHDSGEVTRMMLMFQTDEYKAVMEKVMVLVDHFKMTNLTDLFIRLVNDAHLEVATDPE